MEVEDMKPGVKFNIPEASVAKSVSIENAIEKSRLVKDIETSIINAINEGDLETIVYIRNSEKYNLPIINLVKDRLRELGYIVKQSSYDGKISIEIDWRG